MYLIDTHVISEARKGAHANTGVRAFFAGMRDNDTSLYLCAITLGELRRGADLIRHRGDTAQADLLDRWIASILAQFADNILPFDHDAAQVWGRLRVPHPENAIDKQTAAIALTYDLTFVTRNTNDFVPIGVKLHNPFSG
jgi:predicted nucleic acid-binding protein